MLQTIPFTSRVFSQAMPVSDQTQLEANGSSAPDGKIVFVSVHGNKHAPVYIRKQARLQSPQHIRQKISMLAGSTLLVSLVSFLALMWQGSSTDWNIQAAKLSLLAEDETANDMPKPWVRLPQLPPLFTVQKNEGTNLPKMSMSSVHVLPGLPPLPFDKNGYAQTIVSSLCCVAMPVCVFV